MKTILKAFMGTLLIFPLSACGGEKETPLDTSDPAVQQIYSHIALVGVVKDCAEAPICENGLLVSGVGPERYYLSKENVLKFGGVLEDMGKDVGHTLSLKKSDSGRKVIIESHVRNIQMILFKHGKKVKSKNLTSK